MKGLRVYRNLPDSMVLALRIVLDEDGKAIVLPGDDHVEAATRAVGAGVVSLKQRRVFTPDDGEDYLTAVHEMLSRSSYWIPMPDAEVQKAKKPSPRSRRRTT